MFKKCRKESLTIQEEEEFICHLTGNDVYVIPVFNNQCSVAHIEYHSRVWCSCVSHHVGHQNDIWNHTSEQHKDISVLFCMNPKWGAGRGACVVQFQNPYSLKSSRFNWFVFCFLRGPHVNSILHEKNMDSAKCCQRSLQRESLSFMKGVMDECTHMANFSGKF